MATPIITSQSRPSPSPTLTVAYGPVLGRTSATRRKCSLWHCWGSSPERQQWTTSQQCSWTTTYTQITVHPPTPFVCRPPWLRSPPAKARRSTVHDCLWSVAFTAQVTLAHGLGCCVVGRDHQRRRFTTDEGIPCGRVWEACFRLQTHTCTYSTHACAHTHTHTVRERGRSTDRRLPHLR